MKKNYKNNILKNNLLLLVKKNSVVYYKILSKKSLVSFLFLLKKNFEKNKFLLEEIENNKLNFKTKIFFNKNCIYNEYKENFDNIKDYLILDFDSKIIVTSILKEELEEKYKKDFKSFEILRIF